MWDFYLLQSWVHTLFSFAGLLFKGMTTSEKLVIDYTHNVGYYLVL